MECPYCSHEDTKVLESRSTEDSKTIRRRRECSVCLKRFTTYERVEFVQMIVVKNNNSKEVYSRDKLTSSIVRSCSKSKISAMIIDAIIDRVEAEMYKNYSREIPSSVLGEMVMSQLQKADPMSYLRYASIFKKFTSIGEFIDETKGIEDSLLGLKFEESDRMKLQGVKPAI